MLCILGSISRFCFLKINYETHVICVFYFSSLTVVQMIYWQAATFWVYGKSWLFNFSRESGYVFTFSLCGAMGIGFICKFISSLSTVQNKCNLFNLHAGNMLCFFSKQIYRRVIWLIFLFVFKQGPALYTDRSQIS